MPMDQLATAPCISAKFAATFPAGACLGQGIKEQRLPFTVTLVQSEDELKKAVQVRHAAYARHVPALAEKLKVPESMDYDSDVAILLAKSKLDGSPLGTARIQTNTFRPLSVEQSVTLPARLAGQRLAEVTRLGVETGRIGVLVKTALFKACFQYFVHNRIDWAIAAGRAPIDQQYAHLLFEDLFPETGFIPLRHAGDIPHRVMAFELSTAYERWVASAHSLLDFVCHTHHPDIRVDGGRVDGSPSMAKPYLRLIKQRDLAAMIL